MYRWQNEIHPVGNCFGNFCEMGIIATKRQKCFLELWTILENLLKLWMFVMKRM